MSIYGFVTKTETPTVANDALVGDLSSYIRWSEENSNYQINTAIDPRNTMGTWITIQASTHDYLHPNGGGKDITVGQLVARLANRERDNADLTERLNKSRDEAQRAIEMIGERLIDESNARGWCSEFDDLIDQANGNLPGWLQLPTRQREYEVRWSEEYTITVHRSTVVLARNEEDAIEIAGDGDEADEYEMREAISMGNWSYVGDNGDFEAGEA